ncbi:MAG: hypothetical protein LPJ95_01275, partial [Paracoccaceae bacterium]|nr:hypothetical protein [Paracoccaceae bacterium]
MMTPPLRQSMLSAALALLAGAGAAAACEAVPRTTLALYDSTREPAPRDTRIHRYAEIVLNHLGQVVVYHDIARNAAPAVDPASVALVMSWLDAPVQDVSALGAWLTQEGAFCDEGPAVVAFDDLATWAAIDPSGRAMAAMGVTWDAGVRAIGVDAAVSTRDRALTGFETDFLLVPGEYHAVGATPAARVLLQIAPPGDPVTLATLGPRGGYAHASAAVQAFPGGGTAWVTDPFGFFETVLAQDAVPKPDPTTFQGLRSFFATVLPTGWLDILPAPVFGEPDRLASEVLVEDIIEAFGDLPMSVAHLAGDMTAE